MNERAERPKVSVVIPVGNEDKYLVRCLESVVKQTLREIEIILVDDGERDRRREIVDFYEQTDPRVVAIHESGLKASFGAKVNRGLDRAAGEFVAIVEPDDFIGAEMYERMYECAARTGANIVKTPFYNYESKDNSQVDKSRGFINTNVPKGKPFSIFQFPHLLAMPPSVWSAIYRTEELRRQNVRFAEEPGAGYADNCFYVDAYVRMGRIVWLNEPFYRWRVSSETDPDQPRNWDRTAMLERWGRNLDMYPPDAAENKALVPAFAERACSAILERYMEGWTFDEKQYAALAAYLRRFSEKQLQSALRLSEKRRKMLVQCRKDPDRFRAIYFPSSVPAGKALSAKIGRRPAWVKQLYLLLADGNSAAAVFRWSAYLLLMALAVRMGTFGGLLPEAVCGPLALICGVLSVLCVPVMIGCLWAGARQRKQQENQAAGR